jgi:hypothetical protein
MIDIAEGQHFRLTDFVRGKGKTNALTFRKSPAVRV